MDYYEIHTQERNKMKTTEQILAEIKLATASSEEAETNIKYCNIKEERLKKKELKKVSAECLSGISGSETISGTTATPPLVPSFITSSLPLSPNGDIARNDSLVSLQDGTTSSANAQEVVKENAAEGSGPDIHYAKVTVRKPAKNTRRRKINFDFNVTDSNKMNKLTFATTDKFWEWERDIKRDYENGSLSEQDWAWYQRVAADYKKAKGSIANATIGKGCQRGNSKAMKKTACIYTGTEVNVYIGSWEHCFELEGIFSGPAATHHDAMAEYRNNRTGYQDLSWE